MNKKKILNELRKKYPKANIVLNDQQNPTEIICEIEPTSKHSDYDIAIAVIDKSIPHYHKKTTEEYEVIKGKLVLTVGNKKIILKKGDKFVIKPNTIHFGKGQETWVKTTSKPGWTQEDHLLIPPQRWTL